MTDYSLLKAQLLSFAETDRHFVPLLANASALLYDALENVNWAGFYLVREDQLVLGPFQGRPACVHIKKGRGVCGTAWAEGKTERVPDVHVFSGHIACDCASRSEIVIPLRRGENIVGVLDIDSPMENRFSPADQAELEEFARALEEAILWE